MKYYKDNENLVYAYPADGRGDAYIKTGHVLITEEEADELRNPPPTPEQLIAEIKARLNQIDLDSVRPLRAIAAGEAIQADHDRLAALTSEATALRQQLATLTAQDNQD